MRASSEGRYCSVKEQKSYCYPPASEALLRIYHLWMLHCYQVLQSQHNVVLFTHESNRIFCAHPAFIDLNASKSCQPLKLEAGALGDLLLSLMILSTSPKTDTRIKRKLPGHLKSMASPSMKDQAESSFSGLGAFWLHSSPSCGHFDGLPMPVNCRILSYRSCMKRLKFSHSKAPTPSAMILNYKMDRIADSLSSWEW
ncbi:hypothetical protein SDJN03_24504, partial [Cucurbita argyrosperma subsp. sororia]